MIFKFGLINIFFLEKCYTNLIYNFDKTSAKSYNFKKYINFFYIHSSSFCKSFVSQELVFTSRYEKKKKL